MNILIISESLAVGGGAERMAATLGNELCKHGNNIYFLAFMDSEQKYDIKGKYFSFNYDYKKSNSIKKILDLIKYSYKIKVFGDEKNIDAIISVGEISNYNALLSRLIFRNKCKVIISQHINPGTYLKKKSTLNMIKFLYPKADRTVCVSKEIEKILKNDFGIKNTLTIYNMMDVDENIRLSYHDLPEEFKKLFKDGFNFINIGRLSEQKGQWFLIRSFKRVVDKYADAKLFILGEGELKSELQNLITKLNLHQNVFLLGNQNNVFPYLRDSACFVFSSLWEGFPMTLIEALSIDLPVISADCKTGPREILCPQLELDSNIEYPHLCRYGILTNPFNRESIFEGLDEVPLLESEQMLTDSMLKIIESPELVKKCSNGLEFALELDNKLIVKKWQNLLGSN